MSQPFEMMPPLPRPSQPKLDPAPPPSHPTNSKPKQALNSPSWMSPRPVRADRGKQVRTAPASGINLIGFDQEITEEFVRMVCRWYDRGYQEAELIASAEALYGLAIEATADRYVNELMKETECHAQSNPRPSPLTTE